MTMMMTVVALLSACGNATTTNTDEVTTVAASSTSSPTTADEPSKEAIAHYCSSMHSISPEQFSSVPPAQVQTLIAAQMSEAAKVQKISDWSVFERWLRDTAASDRQAGLESLIQKHGLQSKCLAVTK